MKRTTKTYLWIIMLIILWELLDAFFVGLSYQSGIETGYMSLGMLFLLFYLTARKKGSTFSFIKGKAAWKQRIPEVIARYGWVELIRFGVLLALVAVLAFCTELPTFSGSDLPLADVSLSLLYTLAMTGFLTPIVEEFVFRGVIYDLTKGSHRRSALLFNVILFSLLHINLLSIIKACIMGVALFALREKYDDIKSCILLHSMANLLGIVNANVSTTIALIISLAAIVYYLKELLHSRKIAVRNYPVE